MIRKIGKSIWIEGFPIIPSCPGFQSLISKVTNPTVFDNFEKPKGFISQSWPMSGRSALKGFRTQTLYIIYRVLSSGNSGYSFVPEGNEDLDIYDEQGQIIELIQVKHLSSKLTFSDLGSPKGKKTSFFQRSEDQCLNGRNPKLTVVSFGVIGTELVSHSPSNASKLESKLVQMGIKKANAQTISKSTTILCLHRMNIEEFTKKLIKETKIAIDPEIAFDYLHAIVEQYSEQGKEFTRKHLLELLDKVGAFVADRGNVLRHLHATIRPFANAPDASIDIAELENEYRQGASARYEHILADLDIVRTDKFEEIHARFQTAKTVVVHGASGQGKSTLALRYIHDSKQHWRAYKADLSDSHQEVFEQIRTLATMAMPLEVPILIYIDVDPGNTLWTKVLSELNYASNLRFLVAIRSEDWNRSVGTGVDFKCAPLELVFDENEARAFFNLSEAARPDANHLDFEEAWEKFGGNGPLMEFNFLLSQGQSLHDRLEGQVAQVALRGNSAEGLLNFLFAVCYADSCGCNVSAAKARQGVLGEYFTQAIVLFEKEHLIRVSESKGHLAGLHPIRSSILIEILMRRYFRLPEEGFTMGLDLIDEKQLFQFLSKSFLRHKSIRENANSLLDFHRFSTWTGCRNCLLALIWLGCYTFAKKYAKAFQEAFLLDPSLLMWTYHLDVSGTLDPRGLDGIPELKRAADWFGEKVKAYGMKKEEYFRFVNPWIASAPERIPSKITAGEIGHLGELLYWFNHFSIGNVVLPPLDSMLDAVRNSSLSDIAALLMGLNEYHGTRRDLVQEIQQTFIDQIQRREKIVALEMDQERVTAHYLIDIFREEQGPESRGGYAHGKSLEIVRLLRLGLPSFNTFAAKGYGHGLAVMVMDGHDDSEKAIAKEGLLLQFLPVINYLARNLAIWAFRPENWMDFAQRELQLQSEALDEATRLQDALSNYFKSNRTTSALNTLIASIRKKPLALSSKANPFPKATIDELGAVSESSDARFKILQDNPFDSNDSSEVASPQLASARFDSFRKAKRAYYFHLGNFLRQSTEVIVAMDSKAASSTDQIIRVSKSNVQDAFIDIHEYGSEFIELFGKYLDEDSARSLFKKERKVLLNLLTLWEAFCNPSRYSNAKFVLDGENRIENHRSAFESHVTENLKKLSRKLEAGFRVHFRREQRFVLVTIDTAFPLQTINYVAEVFSALASILRDVNPLELKSTMLDLNYTDFYVAPLIKGKALNQNVWRYKSYNFRNGGIEKLKIHNWIPMPIDGFDLHELGIEFWSKEFSNPIRFQSAYGSLMANAARIAELAELEKKVASDSVGEAVFMEFITTAKVQCEAACQEIQQPMIEELERIQQMQRLGEASELDHDLLAALVDLWNAIKLPKLDDAHDSQVILHLEDIDEWSNRIRGASEQFTIAYYGWLESVAGRV